MWASAPPETTRPPRIASGAALTGIFGIVLLSIWVGINYWWAKDPALAALTIAAELVAFAGLAVAIWKFRAGEPVAACIGVMVTIIAAAWCALTMFQKIEADTRARVIAQAQELPQYVFAKSAADTASALLEERLTHPNPRPTCLCPETIAAWEAAEGAAIDRLRQERDAAIAQMSQAIPPHQTDWAAIARGVGVEIAKLLGFIAFGLAAVGGSTPPATRFRPVAATAAAMGLAALPVGVAGATTAPTPVEQPATPAPLRMVSEADLTDRARALKASGWGQIAIAAKLSQETGTTITRHRVRKMLGLCGPTTSDRPALGRGVEIKAA